MDTVTVSALAPGKIPRAGQAMKLYPLGAWYLEEAMKGKMGMLPLVNAPE